MKISFYINKTDSSPSSLAIYNGLNKLVDSGKVTDANLFFNDIDFMPVQPKFGMFDGSNIWHYTGTLVATTLKNLNLANLAVNKFKLVYMYDKSQVDGKQLYNLLQSVGIPVIALTKENQDEYYRLTGVRPTLFDSVEDINLEKLEINHE